MPTLNTTHVVLDKLGHLPLTGSSEPNDDEDDEKEDKYWWYRYHKAYSSGHEVNIIY